MLSDIQKSAIKEFINSYHNNLDDNTKLFNLIERFEIAPVAGFKVRRPLRFGQGVYNYYMENHLLTCNEGTDFSVLYSCDDKDVVVEMIENFIEEGLKELEDRMDSERGHLRVLIDDLNANSSVE